MSSPEQSPSRGAYDEKYETIQAIGKGAFGFVKTARRRSDNKQVLPLDIIKRFFKLHLRKKRSLFSSCRVSVPMSRSVYK